MQTIKGEDILVTIAGKESLHASTHSLKISIGKEEFQSKHSNGKVFIPGDAEWSISGDGLVVVDATIQNTDTSLDILKVVLDKTICDVVVKSNITGFPLNYTGKAFFTSFEISGSAGEKATYSYELSHASGLTAVTDSRSTPKS